MPESGTSGSVRGVRRNAHPYRDKHAPPQMEPIFALPPAIPFLHPI